MQRLVPEDAEDVAELDMELFPDNCFNETTIRAEIAAGAGYALRLFHGELIGYALVRSSGGMRDLTRIGVRADKQRRRHGTNMLKEVLADAYEAREDTLLCVQKDNPVALRLYLNYDFRIVGDLGLSWVMVRPHIDCERKVEPHVQL